MNNWTNRIRCGLVSGARAFGLNPVNAIPFSAGTASSSALRVGGELEHLELADGEVSATLTAL